MNRTQDATVPALKPYAAPTLEGRAKLSDIAEGGAPVIPISGVIPA